LDDLSEEDENWDIVKREKGYFRWEEEVIDDI